MPIIPASTQARKEDYFRLERELAEQRTPLMSDRTAFLLPVVIEATRGNRTGSRDPFSVLLDTAKWGHVVTRDTQC